jgi:hypothetical protein
MSRSEFAVRLPVAALLLFLAARACGMRWCAPTPVVPPPRCGGRSAFTCRPLRVLGAARYWGRAALGGQQIRQRHCVDGFSRL